jgi:hypothetical protein
MLRRLVAQWEEVKAELPRLNSAAEVRPADGYAVFQPLVGGPAEVVPFELRPVVFNFPEKAQHPRNDLFVVVQGRLAFRRVEFAEKGLLVTHTFSTEVGYFRRTKDALSHVYGAHYDFAGDEVGHPAFHAQMKSFSDLSSCVNKQYGCGKPVTDCVEGLLKTVRLPVAQMDVFSLFVQLCADHLLYKDSGPEEKAAFNALLEKARFCQGAAFQMPRLGTDEARICYRARHWYPTIA